MMIVPMQTNAEWSWQEKESNSLTPCRTLQQFDIQLPLVRSWQREFGIQGIQFGSWDGRQDFCLNVDIIGLTDGQHSTENECLYQVDDNCYFVRLDVRKPLPFADQSFNWAYAEHLIEHLNLEDGIFWLSEINRILVPGGLLRLTTPDLRKYLKAYLYDDGFFTRHRKCLIELGAPAEETPDRKAFMINQIFKFYGHRWIYDIEELRYALCSAGFLDTNIIECAFHKGALSTVAELDRAVRSDESIYIEAQL
jgi:predicted SAM-dependent methyltransferase